MEQRLLELVNGAPISRSTCLANVDDLPIFPGAGMASSSGVGSFHSDQQLIQSNWGLS
ncbi:MAG: hypothetical protein ACRECW_11550 [Phyllobacterium sp.]